jgi:hypothetical protein
MEQDNQYMYNVTFKGVPATIVAVEKQWLLHILCILLVALRIQHTMRMRHIVSCGLTFHIILSTAPFSRKKMVTLYETCSNFLYSFVRNKSHSKKNWHDQKFILVFMWSAGYSCQILVEVVF